MRLTPLDIQNHHFSSRLRGIDPVEVESFLHLLAEDYEALLKERDALENRVRALDGKVEDLGRNEKALQDTLVTAQMLSEDLKKTALREAEVIVGEAELRSEKVLASSHARAARLTEEIRELKGLRSRVGSALRQTLESHLQLVDSLTAIDDADVEADKVAYLQARADERSGA